MKIEQVLITVLLLLLQRRYDCVVDASVVAVAVVPVVRGLCPAGVVQTLQGAGQDGGAGRAQGAERDALKLRKHFMTLCR